MVISSELDEVVAYSSRVVVMRDRQLPGIDLDGWHARAQAQFDGLIAKYPLRTLHHPPVEEIFAPSYPVL